MEQIIQRRFLKRDLGIIVLSIIIAVILAKTDIVKNFLFSIGGLKFLGSFLGGIFFISIFTAAPATVILGEIAQTTSVLEVAVFGGLGALLGDLFIFHFIKNNFAEDLKYLIELTGMKRLKAILRLNFFKWLIPFLGALVIASPFPDELGIAMMGLSKVKTPLFILISFLLNFIGILIIGLIARNLF